MKCEKNGERGKNGKEKERKGKRKERKEKRKGCWGSEVNGGGVAAAVGCTYTDERTVCKDTYLHYVGVVVMGGWDVYFGSDNDFGIYIPYIYLMQASLFVLHFYLFF